MPKKSNSATAREAAARVRSLIDEYDARGDQLPVKKGALWHAEIKRQARLSNGQIDGNDAIRQMLIDYADKQGVNFSRRGRVAPEEDVIVPAAELEQLVPASRFREVQRRLSQTERKNAELKAECASLRAQKQRNDEVAELIALGGRITPGTA